MKKHTHALTLRFAKHYAIEREMANVGDPSRIAFVHTTHRLRLFYSFVAAALKSNGKIEWLQNMNERAQMKMVANALASCARAGHNIELKTAITHCVNRASWCIECRRAFKSTQRIARMRLYIHSVVKWTKWNERQKNSAYSNSNYLPKPTFGMRVTSDAIIVRAVCLQTENGERSVKGCGNI